MTAPELDAAIRDAALPAALSVAARLRLKDRFAELARDELGIDSKELEKLRHA